MRKGVQRSLPTANGDPSDRHPTQARGSPQPRAPRTSTMSSHRAPGCRHACQGAGFPGRSSARPPLLPLPPGPPRRPPRSRGRPRSVAGCPSHTRPNTEKQSAKRRRRVKGGGGGGAEGAARRAAGSGLAGRGRPGVQPEEGTPCGPDPAGRVCAHPRAQPGSGQLTVRSLGAVSGRLGERGPGAGPTLALQSLWNQAVVQGPMSQASLLGGRGGPVAHSRSLTSSPLLPTQRTCRLRWPRPHRTEHCGGEAGRAGPSRAEPGPGLPSSRPAVALEPAGHPDPWPSGYTALRGEQGTLGPVLVGPPT